LLACLGIVGLAMGRPAAPAQDFRPGCSLPFDSIKEAHPIDHLCPQARGNVPDPPVAANDAEHALQNERKNNFCATGGPALVTFFSFRKLQQKLDQKSETSGKNEDTDIHVVLISSSDRENTAECSSVTAEVSRHFRPETWDAHHLLLANAHPLRFTGQLFYDAAHRPCSGNSPTAASHAPARVSSWEVHPVHAIDVCKKKGLQNCKANDESAWSSLDQWQPDE
jgi:hypothetical protein